MFDKKKNFCVNAIMAGLLSIVFVQESSAVELYAKLEREGDSFKIAKSFFTEVPVNSDESFVFSEWMFKASNLDPAFKTQRFKCTINTRTKTDGCEKYRNNEKAFVYVNRLPSYYGKTPEERRAIESKGGSAMTEGAKSVAGGIVALPFLAVASPFLLLGAAVSDEKNNWIEFNHEEFTKAQEIALKNTGFESKEEFIKLQDQASKIFDNLNQLNNEKFLSLQARVGKERELLADYVKVGIRPDSYYFSPEKLSLPKELEIRKDFGGFENAVMANIEQFYSKQYSDFSSSLASDNVQLRPKYEQELKQIQLEEKARAREEMIAEQLRIKQEKISAEQRRIAVAKENARLESFRKSLKVGADTFCGPVIEVKYPMIKVAVNAQLRGFSAEAWLKSNQVFPPEYGCRNVNGNLNPLNYF